ncbi:MAG: Ca-activated chloride channel family protein [Cryomorphaceae bacterium]|jgi:Ca-activated chloride channel family protein
MLRGKLGTPASITFSSLSIIGSLGKRPKDIAGALKLTTLIFCIAAAAIALARPQTKTVYSDKKASGVDIMIAIDISLSMEAQEAQYGGNSRMRTAKETIKNFIVARPYDRIGIVSFAGRSYLEAAVTLDHAFLIDKLQGIKPDRELDDGTAIGSAISSAATRLLEYQDTKSRIIILITDGSNNSGTITPAEAAKAVALQNIKIHTVAIGSKDGRLPRHIQRYPEQEFDTETLNKIATTTNGQYYRALNTEELNNALNSIDTLEKTIRQQRVVSHKQEHHIWFAAAAFLFALLHIFITTITPPPAPGS